MDERRKIEKDRQEFRDRNQKDWDRLPSLFIGSPKGAILKKGACTVNRTANAPTPAQPWLLEAGYVEIDLGLTQIIH